MKMSSTYKFHDYRNDTIQTGITDIKEICQKVDTEAYQDDEYMVTQVTIINEKIDIDVELSKFRYDKKKKDEKQKIDILIEQEVQGDKNKKVSGKREGLLNKNRADVVSVGI